VRSARFRRLTPFVVFAVAAFGIGSASSAVVPKVTLTVVVGGDGDGTVVSHPAGISCPILCKLHVRKGTRVLLTAKPGQGSLLSKWGNACGTSPTCAVTMTASKTVTVAFKTPPAPPPAPTPTPPPPPAKAGHYVGTYSDGDFFRFDSTGTQVGNFDFYNNGHCNGQFNVAGEGGAPGPYPVQSDGSFSGTYAYTDSNGTKVNVQLNGKFAPDGSAAGTLNVGVVFSDGLSCTSNGTWTAKLQS
jgi:hypothetical protein